MCGSNGAVPRVCFLGCLLNLESGGQETEYAGLTLVELRQRVPQEDLFLED